MKKFKIILLIAVFTNVVNSNQINTVSPDGNITISFRINSKSQAEYSVMYKNYTFIKWSKLGLNFISSGYLGNNLSIASIYKSEIDETYKIYSGKSKFARNYCNETKISLVENNSPFRKLDLYFRAYNDGTALRYGIPEQENFSYFELSAEETFFNFADDYNCWALKKNRFRHSYEGEYMKYNISNIDNKPNDSASFFKYITLPVTFMANENLFFSISEANITDYAGMYLVKQNGLTFKSKLSPDTIYNKISVRAKTPAYSPWRVFLISNSPAGLIESNLLLNLNEPCKIDDAEQWIKPGKSVWSWWAEDRGFSADFNYQILSTNTVKYYIDFANNNNFDYVILDGGWYGWFDANRDDAVHDITKSLPELNLNEVTMYAESKGVGLILWVLWYELERQLYEALDYYQSLGIKGIKMDFMDRDDQYMTGFYRKVAEECAKRKMFVMFHGAYKPDGLARTYPNILTYEAVLGNEYARWDGKLPNPDHNVKLAFTRLIAGPMDYTPGSFTNVSDENFIPSWKNPMTRGTRTHQMALCVVYESGILTLCESPKIYESYPEFDFLKKIPPTWDSTIFIDGNIAEYIIIARKHNDKWFVGGINSNYTREVIFNLSFLESGKYNSVIYSDTEQNPEKVIITSKELSNLNKLKIKMTKGGGFAAIFEKIK